MGSLIPFLPRQLAEELLRNPEAPPQARASRFDAVVLFADISGFTPMSEALARLGQGGTEELTARINGRYATMIDRITAYGGLVGAFGGDAMTAIFPLHNDPQGAAARALQCALDIQQFMRRGAAMVTRAGSFTLAVKIGIAVGPVLSSIVGDPALRLFSVMAGVALDRVADAEHRARVGEVLLASGLAHAIPGILLGEERGSFVVAAGLAARPPHAPLPPLPPAPPSLRPVLESFIHPAIVRRMAVQRDGFVNEHRSVTALFVSFDGLDYDGDPLVHQRLQTFVAAVARVVGQYDGDLNKIDIGDKGSKFLVVFGAPVAHEDDTVRALHCALALRDLKVEAAADEVPVPRLVMRVGIASGLVFCGMVGAEQRREYTVMGDTVNLAARLMQAADPGQIVVAAGSHRRVTDHFVWQTLEPMRIKGWSRVVTVYALLRPRQRPQRYQEAAYKLPMVGREAEMQLVERRLEAALRGQGQVVAVVAEAGMGKSRLVAEVIRMAARRGMAVNTGDCLSHGASVSYHPWHSILRGLFGIDQAWPSEAQVWHLREQIAALDEQVLARLPLLEVALNLEIGETELTRSLDARIRKDALETTVIACVRALASGRRDGREGQAPTPLLIVIEDCHWIDPLSRDLLEVVARSIIDCPVLLLLAYRPQEIGQRPLGLTRLPYFTELQLREFSLRETEWLIGLKFGYLFGARGVLPASFVERITRRSQGNPFYIDQMINYIQDQGISPDDAAALERVRLPDSLRALIVSRIDRLSEQEQVTLKVASVIGRVFRADWLLAIYPPLGGPEQVQAQLDTLSRLDLTALERPEPEMEYLFKHVVTQEVAYESLTLATRTSLHDAFARYIEEHLADDIERYLDTLAYHYGRSENYERQRLYFRQAGEAAQAAYANEAALDYFQRLRPLCLPSDQIGVMLREGAVLQHVGRWHEAEATVREALAEAEAEGEEAIVARCRTELANLLASRGDFDQAIAIIDAVMPIWERLDDPSGHYDALWVLGYVLTEIGEYTRGLRQLEHTHEIAVRLGDQRLIAKSIGYMGVLYVDITDYEMALYCLERSAAMARSFSDWSLLARTGSNIGFVAMLQHRVDEALAIFRGLLTRAAEIGDRRTLARLAREIGRCHQVAGDLDGALRCYALQISIGLELGERRDLSVGLGYLASVYAEHGDYERADRVGSLAVTLCDSIRLAYWGCEFRHGLAQLYADQGRYAEAAAINEAALELARPRGTHKGAQLAATLLAARLRVLQGQQSPGEATEALAELDEDWYDEPELAAIAYAIWQIDPARPGAREGALTRYESLVVSRPTAESVARFAELRGEPVVLAVTPPSLPELITRQPFDLDALVEQAEALPGVLT